jgi:NADP-dependent 3-hydroxy acid dehydrogenase YdfG
MCEFYVVNSSLYKAQLFISQASLSVAFSTSRAFLDNSLNMTVDTLSLAGKTALVTGSGRENGIGAAIARAFARNGASVAIHYVSDASKVRAEKVASDISREFGTKTTVVHGGVENADTAKRIVQEILKAFGVTHIDILGM